MDGSRFEVVPIGRVESPLVEAASAPKQGHVEVLAVGGARVRVRNLEALDGTPVLDVKPVLASDGRR